jgi:(E)-4-hydroxy-3-methylbut-2-enyl-diphosphate synthase
VTAQTWNEWIIRASCKYGPALLYGEIDDIDLSGATIAGEPLSAEKKEYFRDLLLQASRRKFTRPEYIACPGCGRTQYNLEETFNEVKRRTSHLAGMRIAIMGCIVNGPGEMADADWGYVGEGGGKVTLYRGKTAVMRSVPQEEAIDRLLELIEKDKG